MKTTQSFKLAVIPALAILLFTSCDKRLHKEGSGVIQTISRSLTDFHEVQVDGDYDIYTFNSNNPHVEITTDDNIINEVQTFVQDGKLIIEMNEDYLNYDITKMEIKIYSNQYTSIVMDGRIDLMVVDTISSSSLNVELNGKGFAEVVFFGNALAMKMSGTGDMSAKGQATQATYNINGDGKISALQLMCTNADADINGSGKIYVNCSNHLDASIDGSGHIYYMGSPSVATEINGSGSVEQY